MNIWHLGPLHTPHPFSLWHFSGFEQCFPLQSQSLNGDVHLLSIQLAPVSHLSLHLPA